MAPSVRRPGKLRTIGAQARTLAPCLEGFSNATTHA